jgi:AICAR transformylase/IMP cyclohydrolase PurH
VVDSEDYPSLLEFLKGNQDEQFRLKLAWKAFQHVASYDSAVSEWLWKQSVGGTVQVCVELLYATVTCDKEIFIARK